jgi:hypothetical protein
VTIADLLKNKDFTLLTSGSHTDREIKDCYLSDLLSWVMAHAKEGDAWVTIMSHVNIIAVATLLDVALIIIPEGESVPEDTLAKANEEGVALVSTPLSAYQVAKVLVNAGV